MTPSISRQPDVTLTMKSLIHTLIGLVQVLGAGIAMTFLWGWFIVPLGVRPIGILHACGILLIFGVMNEVNPEKVEKELDLEQSIVKVVLTWAQGVLLCLFGALFHLAM